MFVPAAVEGCGTVDGRVLGGLVWLQVCAARPDSPHKPIRIARPLVFVPVLTAFGTLVLSLFALCAHHLSLPSARV